MFSDSSLDVLGYIKVKGIGNEQKKIYIHIIVHL